MGKFLDYTGLQYLIGLIKEGLAVKAESNHVHGNISNDGKLTDAAAAAAGNDQLVIRDADNNSIQTSTIKGTDVADAVSKKHSHSTLTLSTTAQAYDGNHTLKLPASDPYSSERTPSSHTHGNIQNGGTLQTNDVDVANGDKLVITDASNSNKVARASISFDGSTTNQALTKKGTWETFGTGNVSGSSLTANSIILGNGSSAIKTSSKSITTTNPSSSSDDTTIPTSKAVWGAISDGIAANDAMIYKGSIEGGSTGDYGALTAAASRGWAYKVSKAGKINGVVVEIGDLIICNTDSTAAATTSNYSTIADNWDVILNNVDGALFKSSNSFTNTHVLVADGTAGKVKDSGYTIGKSVPTNAVFTDTQVTAVENHYSPTGGTTTSASGGALTDIANHSTGVQVVTGVTKDSAGHVTGVTSIALKATDHNPTVGNKALKIASDSGTATQAITMNESSADKTLTVQGDGTWITGAVSGSAGAPIVTLSHGDASTGSPLTTSNGNASAYALNTEYTVLTGVTVNADSKGHITGVSTTRQKIKDTNTDTKVTSADNHYTPATVSGSDKSASASGATASWGIDVVKGVTLNTDGKGHVTGISVTSGKLPSLPTDSNTTAVKLSSSVGSTEKTDSTIISALSSIGLAVYGTGEGILKIGNGTNYIQAKVTEAIPSSGDNSIDYLWQNTSAS